MNENQDNKEKIQEVAQIDTPQGVDMPKSWDALIIWFVGRFGVLAVVTVVFGYSTKQVYEDMRDDRKELIEDRRELLQAYQSNTRAIEEFSNNVESNARATESNARVINELLQQIQRNTFNN